MTSISPVLGLITRHGERVWFRNVSRYTDSTSGSPQEAYADNKSTTMRIVEQVMTERGVSINLPVGKSVGYCNPNEYWNDSMKVKIGDVVIRLPDNYSAGTSDIYRVDQVKRVNWLNQSQLYLKVWLTETKARE